MVKNANNSNSNCNNKDDRNCLKTNNLHIRGFQNSYLKDFGDCFLQNERTSFLVELTRNQTYIFLCGTPARQQSVAPYFCGSEGKDELHSGKLLPVLYLPLPSLCTLSTDFLVCRFRYCQCKCKKRSGSAKRRIKGRRPISVTAWLHLSPLHHPSSLKYVLQFFAEKRFGKLYTNSTLTEINIEAPIA